MDAIGVVKVFPEPDVDAPKAEVLLPKGDAGFSVENALDKAAVFVASPKAVGVLDAKALYPPPASDGAKAPPLPLSVPFCVAPENAAGAAEAKALNPLPALEEADERVG